MFTEFVTKSLRMYQGEGTRQELPVRKGKEISLISSSSQKLYIPSKYCDSDTRKSKMAESESKLKSKASLQLETIQNLIKLLD